MERFAVVGDVVFPVVFLLVVVVEAVAKVDDDDEQGFEQPPVCRRTLSGQILSKLSFLVMSMYPLAFDSLIGSYSRERSSHFQENGILSHSRFHESPLRL